MTLNKQQTKYLKQLAHSMHAVVMLGKDGCTPNLISELHTALDAHELIKVKFQSKKEEKDTLAHTLSEETKSTLVAMVGNHAILYRQHKETEKRKIKLPR